MTRVNRGTLTKLEILDEATRQFLDKGFSHTTLASIAKVLKMSTGNVTFHYPTKEHMLAELVDMLCDFHWKIMEQEAGEGISSVVAICLELTAMAGACEDDPVIRDFLISAYTSPMCLEIIRKNDAMRAQKVFQRYCSDWTETDFLEAELLVSGIEYATLMTTATPIPFEVRIRGALEVIMGIYSIPEDVRELKVQKVFNMDYRNIGKRAIEDFKKFVNNANEQAFHDLLKR